MPTVQKNTGKTTKNTQTPSRTKASPAAAHDKRAAGKAPALRSGATMPVAELDSLETLDASQAAAVLATLFARNPAITDAQSEAFASLLPDAQADELGRRTRGVDVRAEGLRWAVQIDDSMRAYPGALAHYGQARFGYFLMCLHDLNDALAADEAKRRKVISARGAAESVRDSAVRARSALEGVLRTIAGRREPERTQLATALGTSDTPETLGASLTALARLGKSWLVRDDAGSKILVESAGLTPEIVMAAAGAARTLQSAAAGASLEGRSRSHDTAAVNRAEGRLLFEMIEARRLFKAAHERSGVVPKLSPGPSVRHIFVRWTPSGVEEDVSEATPPPADAPKAPPVA